MTDEELTRLLTPTPAADDPERRADLLRLSRGALPRARRRVRLLPGVTLLLGVALGWWLRPERVRVVEVPGPTVVEYRDAPAPEAPAEPVETGPRFYTAVELDKLEQAAELADPPEAARRYRELGDYYLLTQNFRSATRCYRQHLTLADPGKPESAGQDSWLLVEIKSLNRKEIFQ